MDWAGVGRHGEASPLNAQLAGAFLAAAEMAEVVGWPSEAERCRARAHSLARALEARHWEERRGAYVDVVDPATGEQLPCDENVALEGVMLRCVRELNARNEKIVSR